MTPERWNAVAVRCPAPALATSTDGIKRPPRPRGRPNGIPGSSDRLFADEAVDGFVGVVLERRVAQVGEEVGLVDHRAIQLVGGAGVERAAGQGRVGDTVDEPLRSYVEVVGEAEGGHDVLGGY